MCGSSIYCKAIRKKIQSFSLEEHELQVHKCYACINSHTPRVNRTTASKTDKAVRLLFVERHYQSIGLSLKA